MECVLPGNKVWLEGFTTKATKILLSAGFAVKTQDKESIKRVFILCSRLKIEKKLWKTRQRSVWNTTPSIHALQEQGI